MSKSKEEYMQEFNDIRNKLHDQFPNFRNAGSYIMGSEDGVLTLITDEEICMAIGYEINPLNSDNPHYDDIRVPKEDEIVAKEVANEIIKETITPGVVAFSSSDFTFGLTNANGIGLRAAGCGKVVGFNKDGTLNYGRTAKMRYENPGYLNDIAPKPPEGPKFQ